LQNQYAEVKIRAERRCGCEIDNQQRRHRA
jgi:hypothetical protein